MRLALSALLAAAVTSAWVQDEALQRAAAGRNWTTLPRFSLNLDLPAKDRWTAIGTQYRDKAPALIAYLETIVPVWAIPIIEEIGKDVQPFFRDYGDEMTGLASAMGLKIGDVVILNLVYQLEHLGLNCSNWNNTGPTVPNDPGCMAVDPKQEWCYCHNNSHLIDEQGILRPPEVDGPGLCTSTVGQALDGTIWHGRNLDWNLPDALLEMAVDVDYQRNGTTVFRGTTIVGFVGILNAMRFSSSSSSPCSAYSASINARGKGGKVIENLLEALLYKKAMTPEQHLRQAFETVPSYEPFVAFLSTGPIVNEVYYTVAGCAKGQAAVITRDRNDDGEKQKADVWPINATAWFRLETNYDHWNPVPVADDRRTPGYAAMNAMGQAGLNSSGLRVVMQTWPVFNHHTDYTGIYNPALGHYESGVWLG